MPSHRVRILHLSDLHERGSREAEVWRRRRVLGQEWLDNLKAILEDGPIDLICFTGDAADGHRYRPGRTGPTPALRHPLPGLEPAGLLV